MMIDDGSEQQDVEQAIEEIASEVVRRKLEAPAILFFEMNRPLAFIGSQALIVATPLLGPLFGPEKMARYSKLLSKRENVEKLIDRIEELSREKDKKAPKEKAD
jgi:hypothetical protein